MSLTNRKGQRRFCFAGKPFSGCFIAFASAKISVQEKGEFIMKTLEKVSDFVGKYMAAIVIVVAALSLSLIHISEPTRRS